MGGKVVLEEPLIATIRSLQMGGGGRVGWLDGLLVDRGCVWVGEGNSWQLIQLSLFGIEIWERVG